MMSSLLLLESLVERHAQILTEIYQYLYVLEIKIIVIFMLTTVRDFLAYMMLMMIMAMTLTVTVTMMMMMMIEGR